MFSQASVILSMGGGGGLHPGGGSVSVGGGVSASGVGVTRPRNQILWDTVNERAICILLECILVGR